MRRKERTYSTLKNVHYPAFYPSQPSTYDTSANGLPIASDNTKSDCPGKALGGSCCIDNPEARLLSTHPFGARRGYLTGNDIFVPYHALSSEELAEQCKFD